MTRYLWLLLLGACVGDAGVAPDARPDIDDKPEIVLATSLGEIVVRLEPVEMPVTTANFLAYVDAGWYDGTLVHRSVEDWVIQGGGYTTGLAAKTAMDPIVLETSDLVPHVHGAISMARTSDPDSATSQWFIVDWPHDSAGPHGQLDGAYAAFGNVIEGLDVVVAIGAVSTSTQGGLQDVPVTEIVVTSAVRR